MSIPNPHIRFSYLVIEILSASTEKLDRGYKKALYARYGVTEYWIVDPKAQAIEVYALGSGGHALSGRYTPADRFASPLFPGLQLPLEEVFNL